MFTFYVTMTMACAAGTIQLQVPLKGTSLAEVTRDASTKSWDEMLDYLRVHGKVTSVIAAD